MGFRSENNEPFLGNKPFSKDIDRNLEEIVQLIDEVNPDIVELQETINARGHFMDRTAEVKKIS